MHKRLTALILLLVVVTLYVAQPIYAVLPTIFANQSSGNVAASLLDSNFTFLETQGVQGLTTTGSSNSYVATPADAWITGYSSYVARALTVKPNFTNSGASTINVSGLGAASIYKNVSGTQTALASGDIVSGTPAILICDGTGFLLANPTSTSSGLTVGSTTITSGTNGSIEYNNSGVLGEKTQGAIQTMTALGVGSIVLAKYTVASVIAAGSTTAGSNLSVQFWNGGVTWAASSDTATGTWQALQELNATNATSIGLFQRTN